MASSEDVESSIGSSSAEHSDDEPAAGGGEQEPSKRLKLPSRGELREARGVARAAREQLDLEAALRLRSKLAGSQSIKDRLGHIKNAVEAIAPRTVTAADARAFFSSYTFHDGSRTLDFGGVTSLHVVGSLLLDTMCTFDETVDLAVEMAVRKKDRHDWVYHDRRVLFLTALLDALRPFGQLSAHPFQGDAHKPVVEILCSGGGSRVVRVRVLPMHLSPKLKSVTLDSSYGLSIAEEGAFVAQLQWCHACLRSCPALADAVVLAKTWLRHTNAAGGAISGHHVTLLACHAYSSGAAHGVATAASLFRAVVQLFATHNVDAPLVLSAMPGAITSAACAVVWDGGVRVMAGALNTMWRVSKTQWLEVASHARAWLALPHLALASLAASVGPTFELRWDLLLRVPWVALARTLADHADSYRDSRAGAAEYVCSLLRRGYGARCEAVAHGALQGSELVVGVRLIAEAAFKQLEAGPPANDATAAAAFRALWGAKAELRRFKDGTIMESVVWTSNTTSERWAIPARIASHLLETHAHVDADDIQCVYAQVLSVLVGGDDEFLSLLRVFGDLQAHLKGLTTLPLVINDVWSLDCGLRGSAVQLPSSTRPVEVLVQFANSSAWPDDLEAIRKLYHSFRLKMADEIRATRCVVRWDCLDVHFGGFVFRVRFYLAKEVMLLRNVRLAAQHKLQTITKAVGGFQLRFNTFGQTVRLCQRWLQAHLLTDYLTEEFVELSVIHIYTHPHPYVRPPCTAMFAFFRWLRLLATYAWATEPLLVSINGAALDAGTARATMRTSGVTPFVVTEYDGTSAWTRSVEPAVWQRTVALASHAQSRVLPDARAVFGPNYADYYALVRVRETKPLVVVDGAPLIGFDALRAFVGELRAAFDAVALFFYDGQGGTVVGVVLRPGVLRGDGNPAALCVRPAPDGSALQWSFEDFARRIAAIGERFVESVQLVK